MIASPWTMQRNWGFEYQKHLNTELLEVWISNGLVFKCTTFYTLQDGVYLSPAFKWSSCPIIKWYSNTGPFGIRPLFDHANTKLVQYSDSHQSTGLVWISKMVKKRLGCKWSGFRMGSEIRKPNHLKSLQMAPILSKTI